jgi:murein DD-endopeptidase MepM/ murein hydrolase activator NlpD
VQQPYFIVVLAHSLHGRLRRIHIPYGVLYATLALAVVGAFSLFGFVSSYVRMALKVSNYNDLRQEVSTLRDRYNSLRRESEAKSQQLATFQMYASEVSAMFGLRPKLEGAPSIVAEAPAVPSMRESVAEFDYLRRANFSQFRRRPMWASVGATPSLWPVNGRLMSFFGRRADPFSGEGAIHPGVDISVPTGTPVKAAADGSVTYAHSFAGYGKVVIIDHGGGCSTYYAHLSRFEVLPGQQVRRGEVVAYSGATGRATGAHLHYEVRMNGVPVNPYPYLVRSQLAASSRRDFPF